MSDSRKLDVWTSRHTLHGMVRPWITENRISVRPGAYERAIRVLRPNKTEQPENANDIEPNISRENI